MALSITSIGNYLFKRFQGVSSTNDARQFFEEPRTARTAVYLNQIWGQSDQIPTTAPTLADQAVSGVVKRWVNLSLTAVPGVANSFYSDSLKNAIPFNFGDGSYNYALSDSTGTAIPFGQGDWLLDADTGTLTFFGPVPASVPPKVSFYQYVGTLGAVGANPPYVQVQELATDPAAPTTGFDRIYVKQDGKAYIINAAGAIKKLGSGGGGVGRNYLADFYDGSSLTGLNLFGPSDATVTWSTNFNYVDTVGNTVNYVGGGGNFFTGQAVTYTTTGTAITGLTSGTVYYAVRVNAAATVFGLATTQANANAKVLIPLSSQGSGTQTFVFSGQGGSGTGGGSTANLTLAQSQFPLRATGSQRLSKNAASTLGAGFSTDLAMDSADTDGAKIMKVAFKYKTNSGFANGDLSLSLLDVTNYQVIALDGNLSTPLQQSTTAIGFQALFYATPGTTYRLKLEVSSASTNIWTVDFVDWELGLVGGSAPGGIVTPWVNYGAIPITAASGGLAKGTTTIDRFSARRNAQNLEIDLHYQQTSAGANGTGGYIFALPPALTSILGAIAFDTTVTATSTIGGPLNNTIGHAHVSDGTNASNGEAYALSPNTFALILKTSSSNNYIVMNATTGYWGFGSTASVTFGAQISVPISGWTSGASYSTTDLVLKNQPFATTSSVKTPVTSGTYFAGVGNSLALVPGLYDLGGGTDFNSNGTSPGYSGLLTGWYGANGADTASAPVALSTLPGVTVLAGLTVNNQTIPTSGSYTQPAPNITIRVTQPTTVYLVNSAGLSTPANGRVTTYAYALKRPDFSVFGATFTNQLVESKSGTQVAWPFAAGAYGDVTFIDVTPGEWDLMGGVVLYNNQSGSPAQVCFVGISTTAGNVTTGLSFGDNYFAAANGGAGVGWAASPTVPRYQVVVTTTTRFYLKAATTNSATCALNGYKLSARRVR